MVLICKEKIKSLGFYMTQALLHHRIVCEQGFDLANQFLLTVFLWITVVLKFIVSFIHSLTFPDPGKQSMRKKTHIFEAL